jgi:MFS family permease
MLGPLAGGLIVDYLHWRMIFFVNLPIGILGLYLVYRTCPDYRASRPTRSTSSAWSSSARASPCSPTSSRSSASTPWHPGNPRPPRLSLLLLLAYGRHALGAAFPCCGWPLPDPHLPDRP